jgi:hypothetical protein
MRPLSVLERILERAFERPTARLFRTHLSVVVVERRIERAIEVDRRRSGGRTVVPDEITVALRRVDLEALSAAAGSEAELASGLAGAALAFVRRHGYAPSRVPTVALVQGGCFGGGTGVISACDVVIAADNAVFSITEVRWGLTAAIIIPQLCDAIGVRQVRRYALTGERFGAHDARRIGLVHEVVPLADLESAGAKVEIGRAHV